VVLLRQLTDVQEAQVSTVLPSLLHMVRHTHTLSAPSVREPSTPHRIWECEDFVFIVCYIMSVL